MTFPLCRSAAFPLFGQADFPKLLILRGVFPWVIPQ